MTEQERRARALGFADQVGRALEATREHLSSVDRAAKIKRTKRFMAHVREHGAKVVVHQENGTDCVRFMRPLPDGGVEWTDPTGR